MQWLRELKNNVDYTNKARSELNRPFRNKKRDNRNAKFNELETNGKNKNIRHLHRDIIEFIKGKRAWIQLQTPTKFWLGVGIVFSQLLNVLT